jgi:hypothetical protein
MLHTVIALLLLCTSCAVTDLTEVVVIVEAEPGVRAQSKSSLSVKVTTVPGPDDGPSLPLHLNDHTPWHGDQYTIALAPENPRAGSRYRVEASVLVNEQPIATARLISGFVVGQTRYVRMLLEEQCLGVLSCAPDTTCHQGACVGAEIDPTRFSPHSELAPTSTTLPATGEQAALDAALPAGPRAAQTDGTDAARANGTDAGRSNDTDAGKAVAADAGLDTGGPRAVDAGTASTSPGTLRADAEVPTSVPDAGTPEPDAGGPNAPGGPLCRPGYYQGTFMGDYSYTLFSMTMNVKILPLSMSDGPVLSLVLVADAADDPSKLRISTGCMSGTMMAPNSNRPFMARLAGSLDCTTGRLTGRLAGLYYLINRTDLDAPFTGAISAQFASAGSSLGSGEWDAVEPRDPNNVSNGMGQGSWTASWTSDTAPSVSVDPCADVAAAP